MSDAPSQSARVARKGKPTSPFRFWAGITAMGVGVVLVYLLIEAILTPWARSLVGGSTLTGEWQGEMTTPSGATHLVWIEITRPLATARCYSCPSMEGRIATCHAAKVQSYEMWGSVEAWGGGAFHLKAREATPSDVHLVHLDGTWNGGDEIGLTTTLVAPEVPPTMRSDVNDAGEIVESVIGGHPDTRAPIRFTLTRGSQGDFEARCKA